MTWILVVRLANENPLHESWVGVVVAFGEVNEQTTDGHETKRASNERVRRKWGESLEVGFLRVHNFFLASYHSRVSNQ